MHSPDLSSVYCGSCRPSCLLFCRAWANSGPLKNDLNSEACLFAATDFGLPKKPLYTPAVVIFKNSERSQTHSRSSIGSAEVSEWPHMTTRQSIHTSFAGE